MAHSWPWTEVPPEPETAEDDAPLVCGRCGLELLTCEAVTLTDDPLCGPCAAPRAPADPAEQMLDF